MFRRACDNIRPGPVRSALAEEVVETEKSRFRHLPNCVGCAWCGSVGRDKCGSCRACGRGGIVEM
jgi:hypothetical protein